MDNSCHCVRRRADLNVKRGRGSSQTDDKDAMADLTQDRPVSRSIKRKESTSLVHGGGDNFKVAVRVRPLIPKEIKNSTPECVDVDVHNKAVVITKPIARRRASTQIGIENFGEIIRTDTTDTHNFFFDNVFDPSATQDMIFEVCVKHIVESVLQGYNGSIIASGQTGSGKTYTIEGLEESKGIIPRSTEHIFTYIETFPQKTDRFLVRTSFLEIYNEKISDLLEPSRDNLRIHGDGVGGVYVEGLSEHIVRSTGDILALLREGAQLRTTAATKTNEKSSRSHAVFTIIVEHAEDDGCGGSVVTIGKLQLVDLAGSERLDVDAQSKQHEETKNINLSLHTFGKVVTQLTTPGARHVPYRESKLTRLLQDCLGGNCKTFLIATITPTAICYTESLNTLKFAKRAKSIKNTAQVNKDMSQKALLSAYESEIKKLRHQLEQQDLVIGRDEIERLEKERKEAQKEKEAVLCRLEAQEKIVSEAQEERDLLKKRIQEMEKMMLHGGSKPLNDSEEFKHALRQEHERIRRETETELKIKFAELEAERKRLQDEREQILKQKEYFSKLRVEFQPDGQRDDKSDEIEIERGSSPVKEPPSAGLSSRPKPLLWKHTPASLSTTARPPPSGARSSPSTSPTPPSPSPSPTPMPSSNLPQRVSSADALPPRSHRLGSNTRRHSWVHPRSSSSFSDTYPEDMTDSVSLFGLPTHIELDHASAAALRNYANALAHPRTGIPCQAVSGIRIFTGSTAVKWFMRNMEGVNNLQDSQDVGQRLMDLNVFTEIQGGTQFLISESVYYQFCDTLLSAAPVGPLAQYSLSRPSSSLSIGSYTSTSHPLLPTTSYNNGSGSLGTVHSQGPLASVSEQSFSWEMPSSISLAPSLASVHISSDLLEHFELTELSPSQLHTAALYGERSRLKAISQEGQVDILDTAGHTPLMYAVMGRQAKCCLQLIRLGADVNAANHSGLTALFVATTGEYEDIVKLLLKNGAQAHFINNEGQTVFHIAAKSKNYRCLEYLCKYATSLCGISERDHHYHTPLHVAVLADQPSHTKKLLTAKADLGVSDENGRTALHYAITRGSLPCVQIISESAPNEINLVDHNGWSALHMACHEGTLEFVTYLISYPSCDINLKDQSGRTPLHIAVLGNKTDIVKALRQKGAIATTRDSSGKTALHYCMEMGLTDCAHAIQSLQSR